MLISAMSRTFPARTFRSFLYVAVMSIIFHCWLAPSTSSQTCAQVPFSVPSCTTSRALPVALFRNFTHMPILCLVQTWRSSPVGVCCLTTAPSPSPVTVRALWLRRLTIMNSKVLRGISNPPI